MRCLFGILVMTRKDHEIITKVEEALNEMLIVGIQEWRMI